MDRLLLVPSSCCFVVCFTVRAFGARRRRPVLFSSAAARAHASRPSGPPLCALLCSCQGLPLSCPFSSPLGGSLSFVTYAQPRLGHIGNALGIRYWVVACPFLRVLNGLLPFWVASITVCSVFPLGRSFGPFVHQLISLSVFSRLTLSVRYVRLIASTTSVVNI